MSIEQLLLNESQGHRNNDIRSVNAISITEESPSRDCEQVINLNKNNLSPSHSTGSVNAISITEESPSHDGEQVVNLSKNNLSPSHTGNDKIPPNDQCAGSNINNTDSMSDAPLPKQQT